MERVKLPVRKETKTNLLPVFAAMGFPKPVTEFVFRGIDGDRLWRFDYFWEIGIAFEYEGGTFSGGRHTRGKGYSGDCEKYSEAAAMGIMVIRADCTLVKSGRAWKILEKAFKIRNLMQLRRRVADYLTWSEATWQEMKEFEASR